MKKVSMVKLASDYLAKRRTLGFALRNEGQLLLQFARYADGRAPGRALTLKLQVQWARLPRGVSPACWAHRLKVLRPFVKYRAAFDPRTEVAPNGYLGRAYGRTTPYIYPESEIAALIRAAKQLRPQAGLRPRTYATLLGLLACTGLRISEALQLHQADVDLAQGVLVIRHGKFKRDRLVPLHPSAVKALKAYQQARDQRIAAEYFFVSEHGQPLPISTVEGTFRKLVQKALPNAASGKGRPRLHDLRHTAATRRLLAWSRQGRSPDTTLLFLSKYLGHQRVRDTYWYFSGVPELFHQVGKQFGRFVRALQP